MARAVSELSPKAQQVYRDNPDLAAKRQQQMSPPPASSSSAGAPSLSLPSPSLPDFVKEPLFVVLVLVLGLMLYGRYVRPINLGLGGLATSGNSPTVQSYLDQQNRRVALTTDTMPGRIIRANPAKLTSA